MKKFSILCIGNSHTAGFPHYDPSFGGNPHSSYEYWFNRQLTSHYSDTLFNIENRGSCGQTSDQIFNRLQNTLHRTKYDYIIFWGGANDIALGYSVDQIWKNLWQAYELCLEKSVAFMLLTIPPMNWPEINNVIIQLNERIRNNSSSGTYTYADPYKILEEQRFLNPIYDAGDGCHLSIDGYEQVGIEIFNRLTPYLKKVLY